MLSLIQLCFFCFRFLRFLFRFRTKISWHQLFNYLVNSKTCRLCSRRKFLKALQPLHKHGWCTVLKEYSLYEPLIIFEALVCTFEGIGSQIEELGNPHK